MGTKTDPHPILFFTVIFLYQIPSVLVIIPTQSLFYAQTRTFLVVLFYQSQDYIYITCIFLFHFTLDTFSIILQFVKISRYNRIVSKLASTVQSRNLFSVFIKYYFLVITAALNTITQVWRGGICSTGYIFNHVNNCHFMCCENEGLSRVVLVAAMNSIFAVGIDQ